MSAHALAETLRAWLRGDGHVPPGHRPFGTVDELEALALRYEEALTHLRESALRRIEMEDWRQGWISADWVEDVIRMYLTEEQNTV